MIIARLPRAALFAFGLIAASAWAQTDTVLSVAPNPAPAGQAFVLALYGVPISACSSFSRESVTVAGNRIDLRYTITTYALPVTGADTLTKPLPVVCPMAMSPAVATISLVAPLFDMPPLKAGQYEVWATNMPECLYGRPSCTIAVTPVRAGTLTVQGAAPKHVSWYLKEKTVVADKPFQMQLLHDSLAVCTFFSSPSATVSGTQIFASFLMQEGECAPISPTPLGPVFSLPALKAGLYPVYPQELAACQLAQPPCYPPVKAPVATDTLVVTQTLAISLSRLRAGAPAVELRAGKAIFDLPAGKTGIWRALLTTLDGRMLAEANLSGSAGDRVSVPMDRAPAQALSLLRLTSPDGEQHLLPILR